MKLKNSAINPNFLLAQLVYGWVEEHNNYFSPVYWAFDVL